MRLMTNLTRAAGALLLIAAGAAAAQPPLGSVLPAPVTLAMERHEAGTYYLNGFIRGLGAVEFLVDTGSSYLVINQELLETLMKNGGAVFSHELDGSMADGSHRHIPVYRLAALRLGEGCWIPDVEAAVFPQGVRPILGMNILSRLTPFTFSAEPPQIDVHRCQATPPAVVEAKAEVELAPAEATPARQ